MKKISDIFEVYTGSKLDFGKQQIDENGINFVSRNSNNNGVVGKVTIDNHMKIYKKGDITVPLGGSFLLSAFVQQEDFVTAQNVHILRAKNKEMKDIEKWFYCYVLRENRFKFTAFGREVNKYLKDIEIPDEIPKWVYEMKVEMLETKNSSKNKIMDITNWKEFECNKIFDLVRGKIVNLNDLSAGNIPVVSAYGNYQGIQYFLDVEPIYYNTLTISLNGSGTGYCSYHEYGFNANSDCGILIPKFKMNKYIGIFLATCINFFSYKYMYGRKMTIERFLKEKIVLPVTEDGKPDWIYMEKFIKELPYGDIL